MENIKIYSVLAAVFGIFALILYIFKIEWWIVPGAVAFSRLFIALAYTSAYLDKKFFNN